MPPAPHAPSSGFFVLSCALLASACNGGGGSGDPDPEDGLDLDTLLGKILRLDVSVEPYAIPPDNPFVGVAGRDEIWAYGLRGPCRRGSSDFSD